MERDEINTVYFNCDAENPVDAFKEFLRERLQPGVDSEYDNEVEDYGEVGYYSVVRRGAAAAAAAAAEGGPHRYYFYKVGLFQYPYEVEQEVPGAAVREVPGAAMGEVEDDDEEMSEYDDEEDDDNEMYEGPLEDDDGFEVEDECHTNDGGGPLVDTQYFCKLDQDHDKVYPNTLPPFGDDGLASAVQMEDYIDVLNIRCNIGIMPGRPGARAAVEGFMANFRSLREGRSKRIKPQERSAMLAASMSGPKPLTSGPFMGVESQPTPAEGLSSRSQFGMLLKERLAQAYMNDGGEEGGAEVLVQIDQGAEGSVAAAAAEAELAFSDTHKDTPGSVYDTGRPASYHNILPRFNDIGFMIPLFTVISSCGASFF